MKFGSVAFFKRLIVVVYLLLLLVPMALAIVLGVLFVREKNRADALEEATLTEMAAFLNENYPAAGTAEQENAPQQTGQPSFSYQAMYPHLYVQKPRLQVAEEGVCYLTFDDGPSEVTLRVLETLGEKDIKATFFVTGENSEKSEEALRAAAQAGHTIGVHSFSHDYDKIYQSVEEYLADFDKMYLRVLEVTGRAPEIFRFPGGSINVYNQKVYTEIIAEMTRRGFVFYDWNASASDAVKGGATQQQIVNNVLQSAAGKKRLVVLMHDREDNATTASALPAIIEGLEKQGFRFEPLSSAVEPITLFYTDSQPNPNNE